MWCSLSLSVLWHALCSCIHKGTKDFLLLFIVALQSTFDAMGVVTILFSWRYPCMGRKRQRCATESHPVAKLLFRCSCPAVIPSLCSLRLCYPSSSRPSLSPSSLCNSRSFLYDNVLTEGVATRSMCLLTGEIVASAPQTTAFGSNFCSSAFVTSTELRETRGSRSWMMHDGPSIACRIFVHHHLSAQSVPLRCAMRLTDTRGRRREMRE